MSYRVECPKGDLPYIPAGYPTKAEADKIAAEHKRAKGRGHAAYVMEIDPASQRVTNPLIPASRSHYK